MQRQLRDLNKIAVTKTISGKEEEGFGSKVGRRRKCLPDHRFIRFYKRWMIIERTTDRSPS